MLHQGAPWGALYERITGKQLAPGLHFNVTNAVSGIRPWLELFETDGFSEESRNSVPTNFEVGSILDLHRTGFGASALFGSHTMHSRVIFGSTIAILGG